MANRGPRKDLNPGHPWAYMTTEKSNGKASFQFSNVSCVSFLIVPFRYWLALSTFPEGSGLHSGGGISYPVLWRQIELWWPQRGDFQRPNEGMISCRSLLTTSVALSVCVGYDSML